MVCGKCGAKRGHLRGCPTQEGKASDRDRKKAGRNKAGSPLKTKKCYTCDGDGFVNEQFKVKGKWQYRQKTCGTCNGTGEIPG